MLLMQFNAMMESQLKTCLMKAVDNDTNYDVRYGLVLEIMCLANKMGYPNGVRIDESEPEWPVFYIELPTGQVSWHMPAHKHIWDGHTTEEKFQRIKNYVGGNYNGNR